MTSPMTILSTEEIDAGTCTLGARHNPIWSYDSDGSRIELGHVRSYRYRDQNTQKHELITPDGRVMPLGATTDRFRYINHGDVLQPLIENGWTIRDAAYGRGGQTMMAVLEHPNGFSMPDPFSWDQDQWEDTSLALRSMTESIIVRNGLRRGSGLRITRGVFRFICTNGLEVAYSRAGRFSFTHSNYSFSAFFARLTQLGAMTPDLVWGPTIGNLQGLRRTRNLLTDIHTIDGDDLVLKRETLPYFAQEHIDSFTAQPKWYRANLLNQLERIETGDTPDANLSMLHITNAVTNAANLATTHDRTRPLTRAESITHAVGSLVGALSL